MKAQVMKAQVMKAQVMKAQAAGAWRCWHIRAARTEALGGVVVTRLTSPRLGAQESLGIFGP